MVPVGGPGARRRGHWCSLIISGGPWPNEAQPFVDAIMADMSMRLDLWISMANDPKTGWWYTKMME